MANFLTITKETNDYFTFLLNGDIATEIKNTRNDLLTFGDLAHFKTSNGANLIKEQNIPYGNVTIIDGLTSLIPTSTDDLFAKLVSVSFFDWMDGNGSGGVDRFDDLSDTFKYFGKDGQMVVVDESELKLVTIPVPDVSGLSVFPTPLQAFKMLRVKADGSGYEFVDAVNVVTQDIRAGYTETAPSEDVVKTALDNLSTTISTGTILNQNTVLQTANFRISGTDSYFGTSKFYKSASSAFPAINKIASGSVNIETVNNDDINLAPNGTGQVNITNGWGLGFKPVAGLSAGPDFGTTMGGMSYRPPTESMTKNFLIFRFGQYVFEDDTATWKMILTPTGVNIGGGATGVGGAIPLNAFEVHGNSVIGGGYDRVRTAPSNGLLVEGNTGIGTYTPIGRLNVLTGSGLTKDVVNLENASISFSNGSAGVTVPDISAKSTNGIGLSITGVNIDANPNADMVFNTTRVDGLNYTDLTKSAFRFRLAGSTTTNIIDILRNGNTSFTGSITAPSAIITTAPTTSAGTYDILTRNTSTGVVEKISSIAGNYTPTLTNISNVSTILLSHASYTRIGNTVTVQIGFTCVPVAGSLASSLSFTFPVNRSVSASNIIGSGGVLDNSGALQSAALVQSVSTTTGQIKFVSQNTSLHFCSVTMQYSI